MEGKNKLIIAQLIAILIFLLGIIILNQVINHKNKQIKQESKITNKINNTKCLDGLKEFTNDSMAIEMCIPNNWLVDNARSSNNEIIFDAGDFESIESIKMENSTKTLKQWGDSIDKEVIINKRNIKIDNIEALEVNTSDFGVSYIGLTKNNKFYIFTTNGGMDDKVINSIHIK